jgi:hypothetical protein
MALDGCVGCHKNSDFASPVKLSAIAYARDLITLLAVTRDSVRLAETVSPWHVSPSWTIEEGARMAAVRAHHIFR